MLTTLSPEFGQGGAGISDGELKSLLVEQQGLNFDLLAGAGAATPIALAAIRTEDTIISALNNATGTFTDISGDITITDLRATGTITLATAVVGNTVTLNGNTYTGVAGTPASFAEFTIDTDDTTAAASLANAINLREAFGSAADVKATSSVGVVTLWAAVEGTAGNAIALTKVGVPITVSGATLTGGAATGSIEFTGVTNQVHLLWINKQ